MEVAEDGSLFNVYHIDGCCRRNIVCFFMMRAAHEVVGRGGSLRESE